MINNLKIAGIGAAVALGIISAGAVAQPGTGQKAPTESRMNHQMMDGGNMGRGMMGMMKDPEMRKEMMQMMKSCNKMMESMGGMTGAPRT